MNDAPQRKIPRTAFPRFASIWLWMIESFKETIRAEKGQFWASSPPASLLLMVSPLPRKNSSNKASIHSLEGQKKILSNSVLWTFEIATEKRHEFGWKIFVWCVSAGVVKIMFWVICLSKNVYRRLTNFYLPLLDAFRQVLSRLCSELFVFQKLSPEGWQISSSLWVMRFGRCCPDYVLSYLSFKNCLQKVDLFLLCFALRKFLPELVRG